MSRSQYFSQLDNLSIERIIDCLQIAKIPKGQEVAAAGSLCRDKIFFVLEGSLEKSLSHTEIDIEDTDCMHGERAILSAHSADRYEKTMVFQEDGAIAYADYSTIYKVIKVPFEQLVERRKGISLCLAKHEEALNEIKSSSKEFKLEDLRLLCELGAGQFGVVYLARHNSSYYALKCI
jgi:signal-transduction protein with cAMP-binding, CBS, and nucleotidyltransferase domain